jgi:hypothetical protein
MIKPSDVTIIEITEAENVSLRPSCFCLYDRDTILSIKQCGSLIILLLLLYLFVYLVYR